MSLAALLGRIPKLRMAQGLLLGLYGLGVLNLLPIHRLAVGPILREDYSYHYSQTVEVSALLAEQGRPWGYSPFAFAGYPVGVTSNLGAKGWAWFMYALSSLSIPTVVAFNLFVLLWIALMPLFIYQASRWFGLSPGLSTSTTILAALYWWASSAYVYYVVRGLVSFIASVPVAMLSIAAFAVYLERRNWRHLMVWCLTAIVCGWLHALSAVFLVLGLSLLYLIHFRRLGVRQHCAVWGLGCVVLIAQWPWFEPMLAVHSWFAQTQDTPFFVPEGWSALVRDIMGRYPYASLQRLILAGAVLGVYVWRRDRKGSLAWLFTVLPISLLLLGYFGMAFVSLQPARNLPAAYLWLTVPAVVGGRYLYTAMQEIKARRRLLMGAACALLALSVWPAVPVLVERTMQESARLIHPLGRGATTLIQWLNTNTTEDGRILFEDSWHWKTDCGVTAGYLAFATQRAFVGGPFPWGGPVDFVDGYPFGQAIQEMTTSQMADYLILYNIHWVVARSPESRAFFDARPELVEPIEQWSFARAYLVKDRSDYFLAGAGQVAVRDHRIELWNLRGSEVILKYHWVPNLRSTPEASVVRHMVTPDPYGFIKIIDPPEQLTLSVAP